MQSWISSGLLQVIDVARPACLEQLGQSPIGEQWTLSDPDRSQMPQTVQAVIANRLDLLEHSDRSVLQAAAVVAKPDEKWGETPCAFVELTPGQNATTDELVAWCKTNLAGYKVPRYVVFAELPKTSTGKIQKFKLREMAKGV